jgi:hypothetical protein
MSIPTAVPASAQELPHVGWHVPWAVGGPRLAHDGSVYQHPGQWPDFRVKALRLWDTRTAWLNLQPRADRFAFSHLDAHLNRAHQAGVEHITLVLAGTPRWAAANEHSTDAPWLGPGSASPPADMSHWSTYVEQVATRYRGRIQAYQLGNEPNARMFWSGTLEQLGQHVATAATIIRRVDPSATIIAPAPLITELRDVAHARTIWSAIAGAPIDVLAFHSYPRTPRGVADLPRIARQLRQIAAATGFAGTPLWITEANPGETAGPDQMQALLQHAAVQNIERVYWYAWMGDPHSHRPHLPAG